MNSEASKIISNLKRAGIAQTDAVALRRIALALHRWYELECGNSDEYSSWTIERDETTDKPYMVRYPHFGKSYRTPIADREKGALKRLDNIMTNYAQLSYYVQTDPRGAALYIIRAGDVPPGGNVHAYYNYGIAII